MKIFDFSECEYSNRNGSYGGAAGDKDGILINSEPWIAKYPKSNEGMSRNDKLSRTTQTPLSEYIGSHIYGLLGYPVHETLLGIRKGFVVVACKDFCDDKTRLLEMRTLKNIHISEMNQKFQLDLHETSDDHLVDLNELFLHFELNPEISKIKGVAERFWDQVVIDGLIGNNDRNNGNWGILACGEKRELAPIFDNGASFYPKKSTLVIQQLLKLPESDQARNNSNIQEPFTLDGEHHLNYKSMLELDAKKIPVVQVEELRKSICKNAALVEQNLSSIVDFIKSIPNEYNGYEIITEPRREYYLKSFITRFEEVLKKKVN
jgi:hypothetical protein